MAESPDKKVRLLFGQDEFGIAQALDETIARLSVGVDRAMLEMNTTRLDGNNVSIDQILNAAGAMPFLAPRRLVILTQPFARVKDKNTQKRFLEALGKIPPSTALIMLHNDLLTQDKDRRSNKVHWFEEWATQKDQQSWVEMRAFMPLQGEGLVRRIQELAKQHQGEINRPGAELLGALTDGDTRLAMQEIPKLLAYVNYSRPITEEDVQEVTADVGEGDIFALVDALSAKNKKAAFAMLERLLETKDYWEIFPMILRQFRLLILAREVIARNGSKNDMLPFTNRSAFVADKMLQQARRFNPPELERAYHRLLELDLAVKTSAATSDRVALETFVAEWA